jgi:hypothetical protein
LDGIFLGHGQGLGGKIGGRDPGCRQFLRQGDADGSAAGSDLQKVKVLWVGGGEDLEGFGYQGFRFRAGDQNIRDDPQGEGPELASPENISHRLTAKTSENQLFEPCEFIAMKGLVIVSVKADPVHSEGLGKKDFGIEARGGHPFLLESLIGPADESQDGP